MWSAAFKCRTHLGSLWYVARSGAQPIRGLKRAAEANADAGGGTCWTCQIDLSHWFGTCADAGGRRGCSKSVQHAASQCTACLLHKCPSFDMLQRAIDRRCLIRLRRYQCVSRCLRTSKAQGNDQNQHRHAWSERHTSALGQLKSAVVGTARAGNARRQQARTLGGLRAAGRQPAARSQTLQVWETMLAPMLACRRSDPMLAPITNCMLA